MLPSSTVYTLTVQQESNTPIQVRVTDYQSPSLDDTFTPQQRAIFIDVPAANGGVATMEIDFTKGLEDLRLSVDLDNDGNPDTALPPTSILDPNQIEDVIRPVTTITIEGAKDEFGFFTGPITVTLSATDTGTGVLKTEYSLDGGRNWFIYTQPLNLIAEEFTLIYVRSVDKAGNQEYPWPSQRLHAPTVYIPITQK